jgi:hypothetical protein
MTLYSSPPPLHTREQDKPTLLVCWWITLFCTTIILLRVAGRFVRTERLFQEDKTAALAIIPLWLRMGCVHLILTYGTNNAQFLGPLSNEDKRMKSIASGLVLASRMFHAATYVASHLSAMVLRSPSSSVRFWLVAPSINSQKLTRPRITDSGFSRAQSLSSSSA